ncbi:unnamed protein product [Pneumocystis jirovecii]|uniref:methylated diphthine methylhydrolase n=1 Tax=Pneumocystis jirovecii TaxID=42068 RepID=L0PAR6_PNEJI|nr:unnamed protein product [Pneumocystis jirovecii]
MFFQLMITPSKSKYIEYSPYPIDVVLFSPVYRDFFVAGSYFLEINNKRVGHLFLYKIDDTEKTMLYRNLVQNLECEAILDMKWIPRSQKKLIVTTSIGTLSIYELSGSYPVLNRIWVSEIFDPNTLILSISLSNIDNHGLVSTSTGELCIFDLNLFKTTQKWKAHNLECWTACYNIDSTIIFSGSDDCTFKIWDTRETAMPLFINTKSHAGGSFDDYIKLFDLREPNKDVWKENIGSAWRLIKQPKNQSTILGCLMYDGANLFDLDISGNDKIKVRKEFKEHESIVYAGDWYNEQEIITCSFYDKKICFW